MQSDGEYDKHRCNHKGERSAGGQSNCVAAKRHLTFFSSLQRHNHVF
jgi:hypothetical protein